MNTVYNKLLTSFNKIYLLSLEFNGNFTYYVVTTKNEYYSFIYTDKFIEKKYEKLQFKNLNIIYLYFKELKLLNDNFSFRINYINRDLSPPLTVGYEEFNDILKVGELPENADIKELTENTNTFVNLLMTYPELGI